MKRRGGSGPVTGPLEIKAGGLGWQLVSMLSSAVAVTRLAREPSRVAAVAGLCLLGLLLLAVLLTAVRMVRLKALGTLLRLDDAGITGADGRTVGWGEIAEVREVKGNGLAFFPAAPAELPVFAPVLFRASAAGVARRRTERFGTPLVLFPVALDASKEDIVAAVRRFGGGVLLTGADGQALTA